MRIIIQDVIILKDMVVASEVTDKNKKRDLIMVFGITQEDNKQTCSIWLESELQEELLKKTKRTIDKILDDAFQLEVVSLSPFKLKQYGKYEYDQGGGYEFDSAAAEMLVKNAKFLKFAKTTFQKLADKAGISLR